MNDFHVLHDAANREWATTFEDALRKRLTDWYIELPADDRTHRYRVSPARGRDRP